MLPSKQRGNKHPCKILQLMQVCQSFSMKVIRAAGGLREELAAS
jgi:hypothetical protein